MNNIIEYYVNKLQGHPSRCNSTCTHETTVAPALKYFSEKQKSLLVIGCGDGKEVKLFIDSGFDKAFGITRGDINVEAGQHDFGLIPNLQIANIDMHDLGQFPREVFHYVYTNQTFEHVFAPFIFCLELYCIMKPNGVAYIQYPSHVEEGRSNLTDPLTAITSHHHPNMIRWQDAVSLFKATGFTVIDTNVSGGDNIIVIEKVPFEHLLNVGVHPDVRKALNDRMNQRG